jgi:outer membrane protein OmpA-like peptidoglycan-associated protein
MSSILKSDNVKFKYINLSKNNLPESRLLIDRQKEKIENKVKEKKKNKNKPEKINKKKELKSKKKPVLQNNHWFKINFMQEEEKPSAEEIKIFYDNLIKLNKKGSITIKGYAQKRENDSTSKVRRLSLKRALFLRSLLLKENFNITQIYVKALGHDNELEGNKDIVIITNN